MMKVVHEYTGDIVNVGDEVVSFKGELASFMGVVKAPGGASEGKIAVHWHDAGVRMYYYPSVFALKILPE
jgi:hypothetical protein